MKTLSLILILVSFQKNSIAQNSQQVAERVFKENIFEVKNLFLPDDHDLFRPVISVFDSESHKQYVYDYSQKNLFMINLKNFDADNLVKIGLGEGSGPGEIRNPTDICMSKTTNNKKLIVIDTDLSRVNIWNIETNKFEKSFKPKKFNPFRVACTSSDIVIYNTLGSKRGDYLVYDYKGNELNSFNDPQKNRNAFLDSGYIEADSEYIYYASQGRPTLKNIDRSSKKFVERFSIEPSANKNKISRSTEGEYIMEKKAENFIYQSRGIGLYDNYVLVLFSGRKDAFGNIIDFYDKKSLDYKFSSRIDLYSQQMTISDNILLVRGYDRELNSTVFKYYTIGID
jgi:hypothetical protein